MIKIAVCDDEQIFLSKIVKSIENLLSQKGISNYTVDSYTSGLDLISHISGSPKYDIIFLDINMNDINGLKVAEHIREYDNEILIVFITAFADYAMEGYRYNAIRYIAKDVLDKMLPECMDAIMKRLKIKTGKITIEYLGGKKKISVDKIWYVESHKHKLFFNMYRNPEERLVMYGKLDEMEEKLKEFGFIRVHKSYLVNAKYILEIIPYKVLLEEDKFLPIPREKYKLVKDHFFEFQGDLI